MRRDPRRRRARAADRDHRQRRADRLHGAEARLGPRQRARDLVADRPCPAAQGLRPPATHRRARARQGGRGGHAAVRSRGAGLVAGRDRGARHRPGLAADDVRGSGGDGRRQRRGGRGDRAPCRHTGRGRWRRPGRQRSRCRRGGAWRGGPVARDVGRRLRHHRCAAPRPGGPGPRVLPCRPRPMAPDDRDAVRGGQPALVPRHAGTRRGLRRTRRHGDRHPGGCGWSPVPPLSHRGAQPPPGPAGAWRVRRAHDRSRPAAHDPGGARGCRLRATRWARPDDRRRAIGAHAGTGIRRRHRQPALAPDPRGCAACRDRDRQHDGRRGVRRRAAGRRRRGLVPDGRGLPPSSSSASRRPRPRVRTPLPTRSPTSATERSTRPLRRPSTAGPASAARCSVRSARAPSRSPPRAVCRG